MEIERKREENRVFSFKTTTGDGILEIGVCHPWCSCSVSIPLDYKPSEELTLFCSHHITEA